MKSTTPRAVRAAFCAGLLLSMCLSALSLSPMRAAAQENVRSINGHNVSGRFLEVWNSHGSDQANVYVNGLPLTDQRPEISMTDGKTYDVQWFERARYESHPENSVPFDVLLGLLGVTLTEGRPSIDAGTNQVKDPADQPFVKVSKPADADGQAKVWFPETGHSISGKILEYWNTYGGLQQFGFPLSEQFEEVSPTDGKSYTVQYFERNRLELHPEQQAPYEVELGLLGVQQYKTQAIPGGQLPVAPPSGVTSSKDTLVIAAPQEPATLLSIYEGESAYLLANMLFNGSVNYDYKDNLWPGDLYYVPTLENGGAYYVGQGDDRHLVVKEKIRFGLRWSDGEPITSNDWVYTYNLTLDPQSNLYNSHEVYSVDNPDANTVIYNYLSYNQAVALYNAPGQDKESLSGLKPYIDNKRPVTDVYYYFSDSGAPLPAHILSDMTADKIHDSDFARNPVGDGPFKVDHWDAGTQIVLVPNPYYTLTAPPLLKRVVVKFISDRDEVIAQLKTGDLDAAPYAGSPSQWQVFDALAAPGSGLTAVYSPKIGEEHIEINVDRPQFQDKVVRQAILTGINRQRIIDEVYGGNVAILNTFLSPKTWDSMDNPDFASVWGSKFPINHYKFDPVAANKMLDDAGWVKGSDGIRAKNGVELTFDYATTQGNKDREQVTQRVAADLKDLGIQANLKYIPGSTFFGDLGTLAKRQFDLAEFAYTSGTEVSGSNFDSQNIPGPDNNYSGDNHTGFKNARYDEISRMADLEIEDSQRAPLFAEMQHILNDELPSLPLYALASVAVHKSNLMNWFDSGDSGINPPTYTIAAMYFK
jgi:peptide/nickel transport system substrate-binding protein